MLSAEKAPSTTPKKRFPSWFWIPQRRLKACLVTVLFAQATVVVLVPVSNMKRKFIFGVLLTPYCIICHSFYPIHVRIVIPNHVESLHYWPGLLVYAHSVVMHRVTSRIHWWQPWSPSSLYLPHDNWTIPPTPNETNNDVQMDRECDVKYSNVWTYFIRYKPLVFSLIISSPIASFLVFHSRLS